jgi:hypothetical protein
MNREPASCSAVLTTATAPPVCAQRARQPAALPHAGRWTGPPLLAWARRGQLWHGWGGAHEAGIVDEQAGGRVEGLRVQCTAAALQARSRRRWRGQPDWDVASAKGARTAQAARAAASRGGGCWQPGAGASWGGRNHRGAVVDQRAVHGHSIAAAAGRSPVLPRRRRAARPRSQPAERHTAQWSTARRAGPRRRAPALLRAALRASRRWAVRGPKLGRAPPVRMSTR